MSILRSKTKVSQVLLRDFLFADDAALVAHSDDDLQNLLNGFSNACDDFGLTISLQKTKIMTQDTDVSSSLLIKDYALETVNFNFNLVLLLLAPPLLTLK